MHFYRTQGQSNRRHWQTHWHSSWVTNNWETSTRFTNIPLISYIMCHTIDYRSVCMHANRINAAAILEWILCYKTSKSPLQYLKYPMKNRIRIFYQRTSDFKYCINVNQILQSIFLHAHATFISIFEYQFFKLYVKKLSIFLQFWFILTMQY